MSQEKKGCLIVQELPGHGTGEGRQMLQTFP